MPARKVGRNALLGVRGALAIAACNRIVARAGPSVLPDPALSD
ncbi:hypothetical protein [Paractinoplanes hotanensis]|nr:hypothetical protein [Actinoplanes hotanensis]